MYQLYNTDIYTIKNEYSFYHQNASKGEIEYLHFVKNTLCPNLITAYNSAQGPPKLLNSIPDGVSHCVDGSMNLYYFHGCFFHSCYAKIPCHKNYQQEDKSIFNNSYKLIRKKFDSLIKSIRRHYRINSITIMPECQFRRDKKDPSTPIGKYFLENPMPEAFPETCLRSAMRGGRVEAYIKCLSLGPNSAYEVRYDDINSL